MLRIRDVMSREVFTLSEDLPLEDAAQALGSRGFGGAPVRDGAGRLCGVLSRTDLVEALKDGARSRVPVREVMTPALLTLAADAPAMTAVRLMAADDIHRVVVLEGDQLVGIVTTLDVCRALARGARFDAAEEDAGASTAAAKGGGAAAPAFAAQAVLVPVDFSERSATAVRFALSLGRYGLRRVDILHVVPAHYLPAHVDALLGRPVQVEDVLEVNEARRQMEGLLAELEIPPRIEVHTRVLAGDPAASAVQVATEERHDLIVIDTRGRVGLAELVLGSVTKRIVACAPCPVLTLR